MAIDVRETRPRDGILFGDDVFTDNRRVSLTPMVVAVWDR